MSPVAQRHTPAELADGLGACVRRRRIDRHILIASERIVEAVDVVEDRDLVAFG